MSSISGPSFLFYIMMIKQIPVHFIFNICLWLLGKLMTFQLAFNMCLFSEQSYPYYGWQFIYTCMESNIRLLECLLNKRLQLTGIKGGLIFKILFGPYHILSFSLSALSRTSLVVPWLKLCSSPAGVWVQSLVWELISPHVPGYKKEKRQ